MNTTSLVNLIAEETGQREEQTEATVKALFKIIRGCVASGEAVRLPDFGTFKARHISDRNERNPLRVVQFLPAEAFRKEVNHRS
jgi:DNA-binding protein HU-beta